MNVHELTTMKGQLQTIVLLISENVLQIFEFRYTTNENQTTTKTVWSISTKSQI